MRVERRGIPARVRQLYGPPSDVEEIRLIVGLLGNVPPEATQSFPDMFHFLARMRCRLVKVADRMEAPAPINPPRRAAPCDKAKDQLDLILC